MHVLPGGALFRFPMRLLPPAFRCPVSLWERLRPGLCLIGMVPLLWAAEPVKVRIGLEVNSPPLSYEDEHGKLVGFTVELLREAARDPAIQLEFIPGYWSQLTRWFEDGEIDALANVVMTGPRRAQMDFSISHATLRGTAYTRPDRPPVSRAEDLAGRRIALLAGSVALGHAERHGGWGGTLVPKESFHQLLGSIADGECDVGLMLRPLTLEMPDDFGLRRQLVDDVIFRHHVAVRRGDRDRLERINEALAAVRQSPAFDRLYTRWIGPTEPRPIRLNDLRPYATPVLVGLLTLGVIFAWQRRLNRTLAAHAAAVDASEEKYRLVVQNAHEGILLLQDGVFRFANATAVRLLGRPETEILDRPYLDFVVPRLHDEVRRDQARLLAGEIPQVCREHLITRPDGSLVWVEVTGVRIVWNQRPAVLAFAQDVTLARRAEHERREAESRLRESLHEKEALLKEVHHRVKNNLQVVTSLLRLESARQAENGTRHVLQEMIARIRAMALLHETLYRSGHFGLIDLSVYLGQLVTQALRGVEGRSGRIALQSEFAPVHLEIDRAIPCGLIVNELVTNALKHAFPGGRTGTIRVRLVPDDGKDQLRLEVCDDGVGLPPNLEARRDQSLGLRLVSDLARQIDGEFRVLPGPCFQVTFPPPRSVSPA